MVGVCCSHRDYTVCISMVVALWWEQLGGVVLEHHRDEVGANQSKGVLAEMTGFALEDLIRTGIKRLRLQFRLEALTLFCIF